MSHYSITPASEETSNASPEFDPVKLQQLMQDIKSKQNLPFAILGGLIASIIAAILWAVIGYITGYRIGFVAIGVGFLVGFAVNLCGKGMTATFGIVGALLALFGCMLGNLLMVILFASLAEGVSMSAILITFLTTPGVIIEVMKETFSLMDLLFYGIAIYEGYRFSIRGISEEELESVRKKPVSTEPIQS